MSQLILVRHGQAHAFAADSDRLTDIGHAQAGALGAYWLGQGARFTECYRGALVRHRQTAEAVSGAFAQAGCDWPSVEVLPELNEYDAEGMVRRLAPALAKRDERCAALWQAAEAARGTPDYQRYFQRMFEAVSRSWLRDELRVAEVEPFPDFRARVLRGWQHIIERTGSQRRVVVFTSGGVIGLLLQHALAAPIEKALELNWRVRNGSLTEFTFHGARCSLDSFNTLPHLTDAALLTYR